MKFWFQIKSLTEWFMMHSLTQWQSQQVLVVSFIKQFTWDMFSPHVCLIPEIAEVKLECTYHNHCSWLLNHDWSCIGLHLWLMVILAWLYSNQSILMFSDTIEDHTNMSLKEMYLHLLLPVIIIQLLLVKVLQQSTVQRLRPSSLS